MHRNAEARTSEQNEGQDGAKHAVYNPHKAVCHITKAREAKHNRNNGGEQDIAAQDDNTKPDKLRGANARNGRN